MVLSSESDITVQPPESVRIGPGQRMNACSLTQTRNALGPRP